jgi:uncharacterized membrane protein YgcG
MPVQNQVPFEELPDGGLSILGGVLAIKPPYTAGDCESLNEIVLMRVHSLLLQLESDAAAAAAAAAAGGGGGGDGSGGDGAGVANGGGASGGAGGGSSDDELL